VTIKGISLHSNANESFITNEFVTTKGISLHSNANESFITNEFVTTKGISLHSNADESLTTIPAGMEQGDTHMYAKDPYKRDYILQKGPILLRSLPIIATPQLKTYGGTYVERDAFCCHEFIRDEGLVCIGMERDMYHHMFLAVGWL